MDNYNLLLNEINEFLKSNIEVDNNANVEVISMYDLYSAIESELEELRELLKENSKLYKKFIRTKEFTLRNYKYDIYYNCGIQNIEIEGYENFVNIYISVCEEKNKIYITKTRGIDDIYISEEKNKGNKFIYDFTKNNYDYIMEIVTKIEEYVGLIGVITKEPHEHNMSNSNNLFIIHLNYNTKGNVNLEIGINENHPLASEYSKNWMKRERICDYANKHKIDILKRMMINIFEIPENFKKIYDNHIEKTKQNPKVKSKRLFR